MWLHVNLIKTAIVLGPVVQSTIKLTQDKREFIFEFVRFSVYIVGLSVLSLNNLKLPKA